MRALNVATAAAMPRTEAIALVEIEIGIVPKKRTLKGIVGLGIFIEGRRRVGRLCTKLCSIEVRWGEARRGEKGRRMWA